MAARPVGGVGAPKTIQRPAKSSANERQSSRASGQPEPTQQPSAIELVRMAEAPGGSRNGNPPPGEPIKFKFRVRAVSTNAKLIF